MSRKIEASCLSHIFTDEYFSIALLNRVRSPATVIDSLCNSLVTLFISFSFSHSVLICFFLTEGRYVLCKVIYFQFS